MATNLSLDPKLVDLAVKVGGERTKKTAVTRALEEYVARPCAAAERRLAAIKRPAVDRASPASWG